MNIRIPVAGIAVVLLAACATQPKPLQGTFQPLTAHEASAGDHTGALVRWAAASSAPSHARTRPASR